MGHLQEPAGVSPWGEERDYDAETGHLETPGRPPVSERAAELLLQMLTAFGQ